MSNNILNQICRVCGRKQLKQVFQQGKYKIWACQECGFGWLNPLPSQQQLSGIYQEGYHDYISETEFQADAVKKFELVKNYVASGTKLLDYGCGVGSFLAVAQKFGCKVQGYDVARAVMSAGVKTGKSSRQMFTKGRFDVITCFDVIEHILNWEEVLKWWRWWLKPGGYLFITTPSLDSWDAWILGSRWYGFTRIPQHVNYFTRDALTRVLSGAGFKVKKIKTWGFVRSINYLLGRLGMGPLKIWGQKLIYLPMTDVMVVAQASRFSGHND